MLIIKDIVVPKMTTPQLSRLIHPISFYDHLIEGVNHWSSECWFWGTFTLLPPDFGRRVLVSRRNLDNYTIDHVELNWRWLGASSFNFYAPHLISNSSTWIGFRKPEVNSLGWQWLNVYHWNIDHAGFGDFELTWALKLGIFISWCLKWHSSQCWNYGGSVEHNRKWISQPLRRLFLLIFLHFSHPI